MHALGIRNDIYSQNPWLADELSSKIIAEQELLETRALKIGLPWLLEHVTDTQTNG